MPSGARCARHAAQRRLARGCVDPRVEAVRDHVVELAELARRSARARRRRRSATLSSPAAAAVLARRPRSRVGRQVDADRAAPRGRRPRSPIRFAPAPQPSSSTRARARIGRRRARAASRPSRAAGPRLRERAGSRTAPRRRPSLIPPQSFPTRLASGLGSPGMPAVVDVPLNTCLADLDEALRTLLQRELERHGFEGVEIAFDAPAKDWSAKLTSPTVNLFLYDLREARRAPTITPARDPRQRRARSTAPPPLRLELHLLGDRVDARRSRTSTGCSRRCSRSSSPTPSCPPTCSTGRLAAAARCAADRDRRSAGRGRRRPTSGPRSAASYKASIDYVGHSSRSSPALRFVRGPEVRTQTLRTRLSDGPRAR